MFEVRLVCHSLFSRSYYVLVLYCFHCSPLGPFVPAPPEVAMQMLREQGGPPPFEGSGRNVWSGPQMSGPAPILALSPAFRQDPRRLRR